MGSDNYFWKASVNDLKKGYYYNEETSTYTCLICSKCYEEGIIYPVNNQLYTAEKAVEDHIRESHSSMFEYFLDMGKIYTGLTEHQKNLMKMFYDGQSDKEIVNQTDATNTSTIRNQRFALKEKYKQAKIIVAMMELLEEKKETMKNDKVKTASQKEALVDIHKTATMIDSRYAITQAEKEDVTQRYFNGENQLIIKNFPAKEKKKIIILQHIMKDFEPNKSYSEKEVNEVIKKYYDDIPTIRRYFIQYGFLDRKKDGASYWVKI